MKLTIASVVTDTARSRNRARRAVAARNAARREVRERNAARRAKALDIRARREDRRLDECAIERRALVLSLRSEASELALDTWAAPVVVRFPSPSERRR